MNACDLQQIQLQKLNHVLSELWERNPFYTSKWCHAGVDLHELATLEELQCFPFTTRAELLADQQNSPPLGSNLTCPYYALKRIHRSSGSTHAPLYWADTPQSWAWVMRCSRSLFLMAGITPEDRLFFALPFGQSSGPWIMYEGACRLGCCCFTAGTSELAEQLHWIKIFRPTVLIGKPSQLRAVAAASNETDVLPASLDVQKLIFTGETANIAMRQYIQQVWNSECFDRYGLTEAGSVAGECLAHSSGMHLLESEFVAEVIDPETAEPVSPGAMGELVLTTLGRLAPPIVRYRTGDLVRLVRNHHCPCGRAEALLIGGVSRMGMQTAPVPSQNLCSLAQ